MPYINVIGNHIRSSAYIVVSILKISPSIFVIVNSHMTNKNFCNYPHLETIVVKISISTLFQDNNCEQLEILI